MFTMKDDGTRLLSNAQTLARIARAVARRRLAGQGLNDQRAALIAYLYRHGPATLYQIADSLDLHRPGAAALLARMNADGLVSCTTPAEEGGLFALTPDGAKLVKPVRSEILRVRAEALKGLAASDMAAASKTLRRMIANLQR